MSALRQRTTNKATTGVRNEARAQTPTSSPNAAEDDSPRVAPAAHAFDAEDATIIAPPSHQSMNDEATENRSTNAANNNSGTRLALPQPLRTLFDARKAELLARHPDFLTRDSSEEGDGEPLEEDDSAFSTSCRFDLLVIGVLVSILIYVLFTEYHINVPALAFEYVKRLLDPGPIQRIAKPDETDVGRATVEAALKAVKQRMQQPE